MIMRYPVFDNAKSHHFAEDGPLEIGHPHRLAAERAYRDGYRAGARKAIASNTAPEGTPFTKQGFQSHRNAAHAAIRSEGKSISETLVCELARSRGAYQGFMLVDEQTGELDDHGWFYEDHADIETAFRTWLADVEKWHSEAINADEDFDAPPTVRLPSRMIARTGQGYRILVNQDDMWACWRQAKEKLATLRSNRRPIDAQMHAAAIRYWSRRFDEKVAEIEAAGEVIF